MFSVLVLLSAKVVLSSHLFFLSYLQPPPQPPPPPPSVVSFPYFSSHSPTPTPPHPRVPFFFLFSLNSTSFSLFFFHLVFSGIRHSCSSVYFIHHLSSTFYSQHVMLFSPSSLMIQARISTSLTIQVVLLLLSSFQLDFLLLSPFKLFILLLPVIIQAHFSVDHHSSSSNSLIIQDLQYTLHIVQTLRSVSHPMQAFRSRLAERKRPKFLPQPLPSTSLLSSSASNSLIIEALLLL